MICPAGVTDPPDLRTRLTRLRTQALAQLAAADTIDSGLLRLVADSSGALAALDNPQPASEAEE